MSKIFNITPREVLNIAQLNKTERLVLGALKGAKKPQSIARLTEGTGLKRLVLLYNLKKLEKRGLVHRDEKRKAHLWWFNVPNQDQVVASTDLKVTVTDAYQILHKSGQRRLYGIQGHGAIKSILEDIRKERADFSDTHVRQKLRQVIIDSILTKESLELTKNLPTKVRQSHFGRPTLVHVIPDNVFISNLEILSDGKVAVFIDHSSDDATISTDPTTVKAFLALHETIKGGAVKQRPEEAYGIDTN